MRLSKAAFPLATLATLALMAGCTTGPFGKSGTAAVAGASTAPVGGLCDAQPARSFVGQSSTAQVVEAARVKSGANMARVLRPGQMITKEYSTQRLNLEVDAADRIVAVRCG